jgi:hypothetical protein
VEAGDAVSDDWREYKDVLDDAALAQFLGAHDWTIQQDRDYRQVWTHPGISDSERPYIIQLPRNRSLVDYDRRLSEAIAATSRFYDWSLAGLAESVSSVRADLFFFRVDQSSADGTIPLKQASALLESLDAMVRSAALVAHSPGSTGRASRVPPYVKEFLNDDVRMGHTKRGSFIITVAARIGRQQEVKTKPLPSDKAVERPDVVGSFTRRVMTTLARGIDATKIASQGDASGDELEAAIEGGMRLPLVKALREIGEAEGLRGVSMNFEWSAVEPMADEVPAEIEMRRDDLQSLDSIEVRLSRRVEPREETIVGPVTELKRPDVAAIDDPTDLSGEVVLLADIGGMNRRVTVPLHGEDYDWAIRAHRERLPFTVSGVLEKNGRSWVLSGHIQADTDFLRFHLNRADAAAQLGEESESSNRDG